jgi:hypothetical protein
MPILFTNVRTLPFVDFGCGGMPFYQQHPNPGFALVGLTVRAGDWVDQVTPIFAELYEDGSIGPETYGVTSGGGGGWMTHEVRVEPGHLVTGMQTRSGSFVDAVRLLQSPWNGTSLDLSASKWTPWIGGRGGVERPERLLELSGSSVAIGIAGRAGGYLDSLTIIGGELVRISGTAVQKSSGRGTRSSSATA